MRTARHCRGPGLVMASLLLAACGDDGGGASNPRVLWLYLDGSELEVKLVEDEPPPF